MPPVRRLALAMLLVPLPALAQEAAPSPAAPSSAAPSPVPSSSAPSPVPTTLPETPGPPLPPPPKKAPTPHVVSEAPPSYADAYAAPRRREKQTEWYGYINLTCDALATTSLYLSQEARSDTEEKLAYLALFTYLAGGPIAHWSHGNVGTGFASLGLRAGMPVVSTYLGCAAFGGGGGSEYGCLGGAIIGLGLGLIGAVTIDAAALAYKEREAPRMAMHLVPVATPTKHGATFGVAATF